MSEYDGKQFVGIDLHRHRSVIVCQSEAGEQLAVTRIDNDPITLAAEIGTCSRRTAQIDSTPCPSARCPSIN